MSQQLSQGSNKQSRRKKSQGPSADVDSVVKNVVERCAALHAKVVEAHEDTPCDSSNECLDSTDPVVDEVCERGEENFKKLIPFTADEFEDLWALGGDRIDADWNGGKGQKCKTSAKDAFFVALDVLKLPTSWDKHGCDFGLKGPAAEKQVHKMIDVAGEVFAKEFFPSYDAVTMKCCRSQGFHLCTIRMHCLWKMSISSTQIVQQAHTTRFCLGFLENTTCVE